MEDYVKSKISVTVERSLVEFLDSLPGESRSEKVGRVLLQLKKATADRELRRLLEGGRENDAERMEREAWENTIAEAMWNE